MNNYINLPCNVGDIVYNTIYERIAYKVRAIKIYETRVVITTENTETGVWYSVDASKFGDTWFKTKEEAEAKLKELEG